MLVASECAADGSSTWLFLLQHVLSFLRLRHIAASAWRSAFGFNALEATKERREPCKRLRGARTKSCAAPGQRKGWHPLTV